MKLNSVNILTIIIFLILLIIIISGCTPTNREFTVTVSWNPNTEKLVNEPGGGYRVYCSTKRDLSINDREVNVVDVPYVSGSAAPTSVSLKLKENIWYIKLVAYLNLHGESLGPPSEERRIEVPFVSNQYP